MNIQSKVTWKTMWKNKTRTIVTVIGIILSAAMFTAVTTLGYSLWSYLLEIQVYSDGDYFVRYDYTSQDHLETLRQDDRVSALGDLKILGFTTFTLEAENGNILGETCMVAAGDEAFFDMVPVHLEEGRLPQTGDEIVITRNIYYYLKNAGKPCEVGQELALDVIPEYIPDKYEDPTELPSQGDAFTKAYKIVGISEIFTKLGDETLNRSHLFTYADGQEPDAVWHRAYVKTANPMDAYDMLDKVPEGVTASDNEDILSLYGATKYDNYNIMITAVCAVLMVIIMIGAVSLIYNAFSISVAERTRQFGLLSCIGATRKQLRRSVFFEAMVLSGLGIPIGILCGYAGISITLNALGNTVDALFDTVSMGIAMRAVPSVLAFAAAGSVALVTVLVSAWIPAKRATRVTPLNAIRQTQDYRIPKRGMKAGKLTAKVWGVPGLMAKKYYAVSKKKYRATILSLAISIVLFISAFTVGQSLRIFAEGTANTNNFDMLLNYVSQEEIDAVRDLEAVKSSAVWVNRFYVIEIPKVEQTENYWQDCQRIVQHRNIPLSAKSLKIIYLEDEVLLKYLEQQEIDPEPYFDEACPAALVCKSRTSDIVYDAQKDIYKKVIYISDVFAEGVENVTLYPGGCPEAVRKYVRSMIGDVFYDLSLEGGVFYSFYYTAVDGNTMSVSEESIVVQVIREAEEDGSVSFSYYLYDPETDTRDETPIYTQTAELPTLKLGASIEEMPYGIETSAMSDESTVKLILPMSAAGNTDEDYHYLSVSVNDREAFLNYMEESKDGFTYSDFQASELQYRNVVLMLDVFSNGFIILISLICIANVFNTISTNIALRRRDLGMLRSVGMKTGEIYRMMELECLIYGGKALLFSLPIGILCSYGIQWIFRDTYSGEYAPPWGAIAIAAVCVFLVVFISMFYAVSKLRKDNPLDAIRMDNI